MSRPTHCRWCGATLVQAHTGRPRLFCSDLHRKRYQAAMVDKVEAFLADHRDDAERRRLGDLRRDLASALASCERLIPMLDDYVVTQARLVAVRDEIRGVLRRHFAGSPS